MSQNVEFILSLEDKQFTASIDRAGKLLTRFGEQVTKPAQKIQTFERSLGSVARIIGVLESKLDSTADKLQDVAAGFELASDATRKMRGNITSLNSGLKALIERVDTTASSVDKLTASLRKVQSELNDFSDWATYASKSASRFGTEVKEASASVSGMNTRLNTTTKRLSNWGVTTSQAAEGLKKVREQMDEVIGRQQLISKPVRVRTSGSGDGGSGRRSGASGHSGKSNEGGMFSGLRGNIFLLGEIGDAARTVTDIMFGWQKPIVEAAAEMERMRVMLRGLNKEKSNPGQAAADDMKYIVDMAQNAPFAMQALTDSFVKFRSAGLDPTDGSLKALVDSVARFGGDSELLKRAAVAVQQMSGKGVVSMEELRQQLGEAVPNAMQAMADAAGITMGELTKAVASGTVEAKQALSLMFVGLRAENENAAKDMMQTYTGALAQLQTSFTLFADRVGQAGYLDSLSKGMKELASIMNSAEGISFANSLGSGLTTAIDGLRQLAQWLAKNQELVINLGKVVAAMVAFKLMRAGIMGVVGAGSQMVSTFATMATAIQTPFNLGATAVTRFNRAARMGLAPIPSLIFAIRGAITGLKGAFAGLTAFIAANPIGAAFTVATVAVAGLITYMTMLRSETSKVVDEIRKIPEAMTAAKRAQMADRAEKLEKQILADQRALKTGAGALSAAFAMLGANASGSSNKWLSFGATVASGLVSAWAGGGFDSVTSSSAKTATSSVADGTKGIPAIPKFANGGIFGKDGVIPLRAYQKGGIANSPQLALFGEGDMNEAYVPLPDGRTIPVTLSTDGMSGGGNVLSPVSIEINVHSDGSTTESGDTESIWNNAAQRMKAIALETIAQEKRPGGSLNPNTQRN
ncbi:tape measure protein [Escherichia coli]|nr:tape measure protein [Escherichia coli]